MMVQTECRAKHCLSYAEVPPIQAAGKSSPGRGLKGELRVQRGISVQGRKLRPPAIIFLPKRLFLACNSLLLQKQILTP
jgi:hypothetical protein